MAARRLKRILYVETETRYQEITSLGLRELGGFKVKVVESGDEALRAFATFEPDLVVLDLKANGTAIDAVKLRVEDSGVPLVLVADGRKESRAAAGMTAEVIRRPADPLALARALGNYWERTHGAIAGTSQEKI
jgi:two-component system, OmpR family, response regulator